MGVLLRKPSHAGVVISCAEIIRAALYIEVFSAVTERVGVGTDTVFLVAESVVVVGLCLRTGGADKAHHVAVGVEGIILSCACGAGNEICSPEIGGRKHIVLQFGNNIPAVQQIARQRVPRQLRRADAGGVVGEGSGHVVHRLGDKLVESIIPVIRRRRNARLRPPLGCGEQIAAGVRSRIRFPALAYPYYDTAICPIRFPILPFLFSYLPQNFSK